MGRVGETKTKRLREMVLTGHLPIIWLIDLDGARIQKVQRPWRKLSIVPV